MDGSGYPLGLKGDAISLESRALATADMFAAMAENRPYREGLEPFKILEIMSEGVPHKLDPECFAALRTVVTRWNSITPGAHTTEAGKFAHPQPFQVEQELTHMA